ncbi:MAG: right-handed parallel beta-helix repeat-containing protein [Candidatus Omnitrophica bacterium]|nr:right-handed parallel beta-helix repeat-containing protein [Candidatus Omnitrophota bacterium]
MRIRNLLKYGILGCLVLFLTSISNVALADPKALVEAGKTELFTNQDLLAANNKFYTAWQEDNSHPQANFWYGLTRIAVLVQSQDMVDLLSDFGFTKEDGSNLDINALNPFNPNITPPSELPANSPTLTDVQDFLKNTFLAEIDLSLSENFSQLDDSFIDYVDVDSGTGMQEQEIEIDYGEVSACKTMFNFLSSLSHSFCVYDCDELDIDELVNAEGLSINNFLDTYLNFLTPSDCAATELLAAKFSFGAMLNSAFAMIDFIQSEDDDQTNDLLTIDDSDPEITEVIQRVQDLLNSFLSSLPAQITIPIVQGGDISEEAIDIQIALNLSEFFDETDPINLRRLLPEFDEDNNIIRSSFPDPTMGGIFPDMTQADLNYLCGIGPELFRPRVIWVSTEPSVELIWEQEESPDFSYYRIYRTTPEEAPNCWTLISGDITDTTFVDDSVNELESRIYYYRLHTYYTSEDDSTYSDAEKAVLTIYVDVNSSSPIESGSREDPFKHLGAAIKHSTVGTKLYVAQGCYHNSDANLHMWNKDGLILEGGYEPTNWTRDIQANETIIDGTGLEGWNVVNFSNVSGSTIDGFTVTGANMQEYSFAISLWQASLITIRNCNVTANSFGIGIWGNSSVIIRNCTISGNLRDGIRVDNNSSAEIQDCVISQNGSDGYGAGIEYSTDSSGIIKNNCIFNNSHSGVACYESSDVSIENNTIVANGGNGGIQCQNNSSPVIKNNIIVGNNSGPGHFGICCYGNSYPDISYNDVFDNDDANYQGCSAGIGDISQDPLFVDPDNDNYHLQETSPCIDAGDPDPQYNDPDGTRNDMGAYYYNQNMVILINSMGISEDTTFVPDTYTSPMLSK